MDKFSRTALYRLPLHGSAWPGHKFQIQFQDFHAGLENIHLKHSNEPPFCLDPVSTTAHCIQLFCPTANFLFFESWGISHLKVVWSSLCLWSQWTELSLVTYLFFSSETFSIKQYIYTCTDNPQPPMKHSFATLKQLLVSLFLDKQFSLCFWYLRIIL